MTEDQIRELVCDTEEYASLISETNYLREKFMLLCRSFLQPGVSMHTAIESFDLAFDIENAAGEQLDVLGLYVGVKRQLDYSPSEGGPEMDDEEFRTMIRLKVAQNIWDGTNEGASEAYRKIFGDKFTFVQADNMDLSVSVTCSGDVTSRQVEIITYTKSLLIPAGVSFTFTVNGASIEMNMQTDTIVSGTLHVENVTAD